VPRRYKRFPPLPDVFADLGPGDPGYRLRPGRTGFDPMDMYLEQGRFIGTMLRALLTGRIRSIGLPPYIVVAGVIAVIFTVVPYAHYAFLYSGAAVAGGVALSSRLRATHLASPAESLGTALTLLAFAFMLPLELYDWLYQVPRGYWGDLAIMLLTSIAIVLLAHGTRQFIDMSRRSEVASEADPTP